MFVKVIFFLLIILGFTLFFNWDKEKSILENVTTDSVVKYRIGDIDPRFKISNDEMKYLAYEATQIWESGLNQKLFQYDENATLAINLIYDERQQSSEFIDQFNSKMDKKSDELDEFSKRLDQQQEKLKQRESLLEQEYQLLKKEISMWSLSEFESGENRQRLAKQEKKLQQQRNQISSDWDAYHLNVSLYNQKVNDFNEYAKQGREYNLTSPAKTFHKGIYSGKSIDIYQISSKNDLKVTLAHEFGHALGLSHHQDPTALMYPSVAQQDVNNFVLRPADIQLYQQR